VDDIDDGSERGARGFGSSDGAEPPKESDAENPPPSCVRDTGGHVIDLTGEGGGIKKQKKTPTTIAD